MPRIEWGNFGTLVEQGTTWSFLSEARNMVSGRDARGGMIGMKLDHAENLKSTPGIGSSRDNDGEKLIRRYFLKNKEFKKNSVVYCPEKNSLRPKAN